MHPVYRLSLPPPPSRKKEILHNRFFGRIQYPGEIENNYYAKFSFLGGGGVNEVLYGLCENGDSTHERETIRWSVMLCID